MRPPKGFEAEKFPLRHRLIYASGLNLLSETQNTLFMPIVMSAKGTIATNPLTLPNTIQVNPHNSNLEEDAGCLCAQMSIIDRMSISLKFNLTHYCGPPHHYAGQSGGELFEGDDIPAFKFLWRPIFNVYPEKMDATDDNTGTSVSAILGMTKDATLEDIVAVTTNNLPAAGPAEKVQPISTVNGVQAFTDFNMATDLILEDHVWDEDLLQTALRRYTNKGALRSCLGRTRHVTLTRSRPVAQFFIDKFVPRAIRRIQPYALMGIQVHLPIQTDIDQIF